MNCAVYAAAFEIQSALDIIGKMERLIKLYS